MNDKVVVTISAPVQMGQDIYQHVYTSRVFVTTRSIKDILQWAKAEGFKNPTINDIKFSEYTGESI